MQLNFAHLITPLYAGILGLLYLALSFWVIAYRWKFAQGIGDGGHKDLKRIIRVHGNFVEYVPLALILIFFVELAGLSSFYIHVAGSLLVLARLSHAFGLSRHHGTSLGRFVGTVLTFALIAFLSVYLLSVFA